MRLTDHGHFRIPGFEQLHEQFHERCMAGQMSIPLTVARFCRQYLQLEISLDYPEPQLLCRTDVQTTLFRYLFSDDAPAKPPLRYQLRVLKELVARIEASIQDWDLHVSVAVTADSAVDISHSPGGLRGAHEPAGRALVAPTAVGA